MNQPEALDVERTGAKEELAARRSLRRAFSAVARMSAGMYSAYRVARSRIGHPGVYLPSDACIGFGARISATDGGTIRLGRNASIGEQAHLVARGGEILIGDNVHVGVGAIIVSTHSIRIGDDALIAEYVVIRDQDHATTSSPMRAAGFESTPISIGKDCWLGAKATVLRGATLGDGVVVGAHALVRGAIPANAIAVGVPARVVKMRPLA